MALNEKQARFCEEYIVDLNATQAAIRAGYSEKTAYSQGQRLLKDVEAQARVAELIAARSKRTEITADRVLQELASIGFANKRDVVRWGIKEVAFGFDDEGKRVSADRIGEATVVQYIPAPFVEPINADELSEDVVRAVKKVALGQNGFTIEMHDKVGALTKLGDHLGMWRQKLELGALGGDQSVMDDMAAAARMAAILEAARGRRDKE
jgi:phage terminase small subunit